MRYSAKALEQLERVEQRMKAGDLSVNQAFAQSKQIKEADKEQRRDTLSPPRRVAVCAHCGHELN